MSSHHVVREKQEPALLILDLDGFDDELLGQLLEWSPTVITTVVPAEQLNSRGIKIDWLISEDTDTTVQPNVNQLVYTHNNAVETAIEWLIVNQYPAVNVIGNFDEEMFSRYQPEIGLVIFCNSKKIYPVTSGFSKWQPAGEIVGILSKVNGLRVSGLEVVEPDTYRTTANGLIRFNFSDDFIFISEHLSR